MCNVAGLNVAKAPLPFPAPMDKMWLSIKKIIDVFHLRNHIGESCRHQFSLEGVKQHYPNMNSYIQVGEQTFTWLYHFKHILCAMPNFTTCFTFTAWLFTETITLLYVICTVKSHYYLRSKFFVSVRVLCTLHH